MLYVVSYDISDDKRRTRAFNVLKDFGVCKQFSLFECELSQTDLVRLRHRLRLAIHPKEDNIRIYPLCQSCQAGIEEIGVQHPAPRSALFF